MISLISCVNKIEQFNEYVLPSFAQVQTWAKDNLLPQPELIKVESNESIFKAYNEGISKASFPIKVFIHQDVNLLDSTWIPKILHAFTDPQTGLVGFVGTKKLPDWGFWWDSGREHIVGELWSGLEKANWIFKTINESEEVECIDGFFMATNKDIKFDENLRKFHFYDMDYSRTMKRSGFKVKVIPHKAWHIGAIREQDTTDLMNKYYAKWNKIKVEDENNR